jgi:hypothetical protein
MQTEPEMALSCNLTTDVGFLLKLSAYCTKSPVQADLIFCIGAQREYKQQIARQKSSVL